MKALLVLAIMIGMSSCTKEEAKENIKEVVCKAQTTMVSFVASEVAGALSCKNLQAIVDDVKAGMGKADLCKTKAEGVQDNGLVGAIVCPIVVDSMSALAVAQIPEKWECDPKMTVDALKAAAKVACEKAIKI